MKVLLAYLHYGPYHHARLAAVREAGTANGVTVTGLEMARTQGEYAWCGEERDELICASPEIPLEEVPGGQWSTLLGPPLNRVDPDLCAIAGYSHPAMLALISLCTERGIPWIVMSDSQEIDEVRRFWLEWTKSRIVKLASAGFVAGQPHLAYLTRLGMPGDRLFTGYDVVENAYFAREAAKWRGGPDAASPYFLASARFIPKKNLYRLLEAYARYLSSNEAPGTRNEYAKRMDGTKRSQQHPTPWSLCLLGDGELKEELLARARSLGLRIVESAPWEREEVENAEIRNFEIRDQGAEICLETGTQNEYANRIDNREHRDGRRKASKVSKAKRNQQRATKNQKPSATPTVFLPGFRQIDDLPRFYAHAGAFVHASTTEQWGLVVNEAMASGLPVIISDRCGCASDLVQEGVNGWTFDPHDTEALSNLMARAASLSESDLTRMGAASERIIANWGPERFASGLLDAANCAVAVGPKRAGWLDRRLLKALARR
jgi:glycosyltransferase involved in cell wall biosynthesis